MMAIFLEVSLIPQVSWAKELGNIFTAKNLVLQYQQHQIWEKEERYESNQAGIHAKMQSLCYIHDDTSIYV